MVPAYTAAAFIKQFARLAVTAPPAGTLPAACHYPHAAQAVLTTPGYVDYL